MAKMQESLNRFADCLFKVEKTLQDYQKKAGEAGAGIFSTISGCADEFSMAEKPANGLQAAIQKIFQDFRQGIKDWQAEMNQSLDLRRKIEGFGKGLIIVVFGRTNAGKSTLGNFLRGKSLREASFDNAWKNSRMTGPIRVVEKARDSSVIEKDIEWFQEGSTETTREIQLFQLPGFLWVDTPGFGSTQDQTLGQLARNYVKTADLIVYLEDSDNPGLESITNNLVQVMGEGRGNTLIAINKSDIMQKVKGQDGKYLKDEKGWVREPVAKDPERRKTQEDYLSGLLRKKLRASNIDAISISMALANMAVDRNDERLYADSNIDSLFQRIEKLVPDNETVLRRKYGKTIEDCILKIDEALGQKPGHDGFSLKRLEERLGGLQEKIREGEKFSSDAETVLIAGNLGLEIASELGTILDKAGKELESAKDRNLDEAAYKKLENRINKQLEADIDACQTKLQKKIVEAVEKRLRELMAEIWEKEARKITQEFPAIAKAQLKRQQEKHEYEYTDTIRVSRSPDGLWEYVKSIFGAKYTRVEEIRRKKEHIIDLGVNVLEEKGRIMKDIEEKLRAYVHGQLEEARNECIVRGKKRIEVARGALQKARKGLEEQKESLKRELARAGA